MEGGLIDLSRYRFDIAREDLKAAKTLMKEGQVRASVNRSYYAIFHALRSVTALDGFDSRKHSGIIAYFNKTYIKEGVFDKKLSKMIDTSFRLREKADYQDFYIISEAEAEEQIKKAETIITEIKPYLTKRWDSG